MPRIFVSYRRKDSAGYAGRLFDRLRDHFGPEKVFRDVDHLKAGDDFMEALARAVDSCDVFLLVIGQDWLDARNERGERRLDDPEDFIRLEIEAALKRRVLLVPVLVEGAAMVRAEQLPQPLRPLARRQAIELTDHRWDFDVQELLRRIREVVHPPRPIWKSVWFRSAATLLLLTGAAAVVGLIWWRNPTTNTPESLVSSIPVSTVPPVSETRAVAPPAPGPTPRQDPAVAMSGRATGERPDRAGAAGTGRAGASDETSRPRPATPSDDRTDDTRPVRRVPDVVGQPVRDATSALRDLGFLIRAEYSSDGTAPAGTVVQQVPSAGGMLERGGTVTLDVHQGLRPQEHAAGRMYLSSAHPLDLDRDQAGPSDWDVAIDRTGDRLALTFAGGARGAVLRERADSTGSLDASVCQKIKIGGSRIVLAPPVLGQTVCVQTTAGRIAVVQLDTLSPEGSELTVRYSTLVARRPQPRDDPTSSASGEAGRSRAVSRSSRGGESALPPGAVSTAPVRLPKFAGQPIRTAATTIASLGLRLRAEFTSTGRHDPDTVISQRPAPDEPVEPGGLVRLFVEKGLRPDEHAAGSLYLSVGEVTQLDRDEGREAWDFRLGGTPDRVLLEFGRGAGGVLIGGPRNKRTALDASPCLGARVSTTPVPVTASSTGDIVCVQTTRGRIAAVQLRGLTSDPTELRIGYSTVER